MKINQQQKGFVLALPASLSGLQNIGDDKTCLEQLEAQRTFCNSDLMGTTF